MGEIRVGVRELKAKLSDYLRQVKGGKAVIVTERGRPIGRIISTEQPLEERLRAAAVAGLLAWSGRHLEPIRPPARNRGESTVADLLVELRE